MIEAGAITPEKLKAALELQRTMREKGQEMRIGDMLVERRIISQKQLDTAVREQRARFNNLFWD